VQSFEKIKTGLVTPLSKEEKSNSSISTFNVKTRE
jgi:hypothetical protein